MSENTEQPIASEKLDTVVIFVAGGVVTGVSSSIQNLQVEIVDQDDAADDEYWALRGYVDEDDMCESLGAIHDNY